jgi:type IV pilus assembly protein PilA
MVVTLVIGILVALALPTFIGARTRAYDRAAQASLRTGFAAARTCQTDHDRYDGCDADELRTVDTSVGFVDAPDPSTASSVISMTAAGRVWSGAAIAASGVCWMMRDDLRDGITYGSGVVATCDGTTALGAADPAW